MMLYKRKSGANQMIIVFVPFWFTLLWVQTVSFFAVLVWHGGLAVGLEFCRDWHSRQAVCCWYSGCMFYSYPHKSSLVKAAENTIRQMQTNLHTSQESSPELLSLWDIGSGCLGPVSWPLPLALYVSAHPFSNYSLKMPFGQAAKAGSPHKDTPRLPHVPVIPLGFPPHVSVPWCSMLKAPAQANKPVPGGWLLIIRLTGGQIRIYTVILIHFYLWESIKTLQSSPQIEWYPDPKWNGSASEKMLLVHCSQPLQKTRAEQDHTELKAHFSYPQPVSPVTTLEVLQESVLKYSQVQHWAGSLLPLTRGSLGCSCPLSPSYRAESNPSHSIFSSG